jgi:hypothetical protein
LRLQSCTRPPLDFDQEVLSQCTRQTSVNVYTTFLLGTRLGRSSCKSPSPLQPLTSPPLRPSFTWMTTRRQIWYCSGENRRVAPRFHVPFQLNFINPPTLPQDHGSPPTSSLHVQVRELSTPIDLDNRQCHPPTILDGTKAPSQPCHSGFKAVNTWPVFSFSCEVVVREPSTWEGLE